MIFIIKIYVNNDNKTLKSVHCKNNKNIYFKTFSKMKYRAVNHLDEIIKMTTCKPERTIQEKGNLVPGF